jgi:hypothetical protein
VRNQPTLQTDPTGLQGDPNSPIQWDWKQEAKKWQGFVPLAGHAPIEVKRYNIKIADRIVLASDDDFSPSYVPVFVTFVRTKSDACLQSGGDRTPIELPSGLRLLQDEKWLQLSQQLRQKEQRLIDQMLLRQHGPDYSNLDPDLKLLLSFKTLNDGIRDQLDLWGVQLQQTLFNPVAQKAFSILGGIAQVVGGIVIFAAGHPVGGSASILSGVDDVQAAVRSLSSGENIATYKYQWAYRFAKGPLRMGDEGAGIFAFVADNGAPVLLTGGEAGVVKLNAFLKEGSVGGKITAVATPISRSLGAPGVMSGGEVLIGPERVARYEALLQQAIANGRTGEKVGVLGTRVEMMRRGYLKVGEGIYNKSRNGIDAVYESVTTGDIAVVESKFKTGFNVNRNAESLLGEGYGFPTMSDDWIRANIQNALRSDISSAQRVGAFLRDNGYTQRIIVVTNERGQILFQLLQ